MAELPLESGRYEPGALSGGIGTLIAAKDPNSDGILVILTPQAMTDPTRIAEELKPLARQEGKPLIASWMGGVDVAAGEEILNRANIPTFPYPDTAARAFNYMWQYADNLKALYETPALPEDSATWAPDRNLVKEIIAGSRADAALIGEALMRCESPGPLLGELARGAASGSDPRKS